MYQTFIGLEIHIHLETATKMFCGCRAHYGDEENRNVCPVCMGFPGVLPTVNEEAMKLGYVVSRALNCKLSKNSFFERKNYFYPDMPKNYQISQMLEPIGRDGYFELDFEGKKRKIRIHDCHLEEDAGKMIHAGDMSLLDFNRAGYPLLEIVTEPDLTSGEETEAFLRSFQRMVRYLGVSDGNMDEGSMKCDANISVNLKGKGLGTKVEIKNMNSPRFVRKAMNYEAIRQVEAIEKGEQIFQETRLWNENRDQTAVMRTKEEANDYRYFPEPDLPPFRPDDVFFAAVEEAQVELPGALKDRLVEQYKITPEQAEYIHDEKSLAIFFEEAVEQGADPSAIYAWLSSDVKKMLNRLNITLKDSPLTPQRLADIITLINEGVISGKIAKNVLEIIFKEDKDPANIIEEKGLKQITDKKELLPIIETVLEKHSAVVEAIKGGDNKQQGFLMGQIMQATGGKASPQLVQETLSELIKG